MSDSETDGVMKGVAKALTELRANQLKREDIAKIVNDAVDGKVTKRFDKLDARADKLEERVARLEKGKGKAEASGSKQKLSAAFLDARKSIQLAPCMPTMEEVKKFLAKQMEVPLEVIESVKIVEIEQIFARNLPPHRRKNAGPKCRVQLKSIDHRDLLMSYASNLKRGSSIDITIPDHLRIMARKLEHKAYRLRQMSKINAMGDKDKVIKTQIRFDNSKEGLVLGIRSSKDADWEFYPPDKLPPTGQATDSSSSDEYPTVGNE